jgi:hypothetical protein
MRLIGLAVVLAVSLTLAPLAAEAQRSGRIPRIEYLNNGNRASVYTEPEAFRRSRVAIDETGDVMHHHHVPAGAAPDGRTGPEASKGCPREESHG